MTEREIIIGQQPEDALYRPDTSAPVVMTAAVVQQRVRELLQLNDEDSAYMRSELRALLEAYFRQEEHIGTADDFHNLAVELGRLEEYALACGVLRCGFTLFPKNVDLLADFLQFGVNCREQAECRRVHKLLMKIPHRRWTWRGFSFMVDYLRQQIDSSDSDKEIAALEAECLRLCGEYRQYFPSAEGSYRAQAGVYAQLNMPEEEIAVLKEALDKLSVVPGCALRYADIMFERGEYAGALHAVNRAMGSLKAQSVLNAGYLYYLRALCTIGVGRESGELSAQTAEEVYADFNIALKHFGGARNSFTEVICTQVWALMERTGTLVEPQRYEQLYDLTNR